MRELLAELRRRDPALYVAGAISFASLLAAIVLALIDTRTLLGVGVWLKPGKFGASIGLYLWTLAWLRPHLPAAPLRRARPVIVATMLAEIVFVFGQAGRGVASHFNEATAFDGAVFGLMGTAIAGNTVALAIVALATWRAQATTPLAWAIRLGLTLSVLGGLEGALMIRQSGHSVGVADGGPGLPITTWSTRGGDLRVSHFLALHALQVLPLLAHLLARRAGADATRQHRAVRAVWLLAAAWLVVCLGMLLLALLGRPMLRI